MIPSKKRIDKTKALVWILSIIITIIFWSAVTYSIVKSATSFGYEKGYKDGFKRGYKLQFDETEEYLDSAKNSILKIN